MLELHDELTGWSCDLLELDHRSTELWEHEPHIKVNSSKTRFICRCGFGFFKQFIWGIWGLYGGIFEFGWGLGYENLR